MKKEENRPFIPNVEKDPSTLKKLADLFGHKKVRKGIKKIKHLFTLDEFIDELLEALK